MEIYGKTTVFPGGYAGLGSVGLRDQNMKMYDHGLAFQGGGACE